MVCQSVARHGAQQRDAGDARAAHMRTHVHVVTVCPVDTSSPRASTTRLSASHVPRIPASTSMYGGGGGGGGGGARSAAAAAVATAGARARARRHGGPLPAEVTPVRLPPVAHRIPATPPPSLPNRQRQRARVLWRDPALCDTRPPACLRRDMHSDFD